jgi:hypothetical protein
MSERMCVALLAFACGTSTGCLNGKPTEAETALNGTRQGVESHEFLPLSQSLRVADVDGRTSDTDGAVNDSGGGARTAILIVVPPGEFTGA